MTFACRNDSAAPRGLCLAVRPVCAAAALGRRAAFVGLRFSALVSRTPQGARLASRTTLGIPQALAPGSATSVVGLGVVTTFKGGGQVYVTHDLPQHEGTASQPPRCLLVSGLGEQGRLAPGTSVTGAGRSRLSAPVPAVSDGSSLCG